MGLVGQQPGALTAMSAHQPFVARIGDHVFTPSGRLAVVRSLPGNDELELEYASGVPGRLRLAQRLVRLVAHGEVVVGRPDLLERGR